MTPAQYDTSTLTVTAADFELKAKGRILRFAGWTKICYHRWAVKVTILSYLRLTLAMSYNLLALDPKQHFTKPPARFTEAALVKDWKNVASAVHQPTHRIISTIQDRGYVKVKPSFYAEKMGEIVTDRWWKASLI